MSNLDCVVKWEKELILKARELHKGKKKCIIVIRWEGSAWQLFVTEPPITSKHLRFEERGY
jgi:hypothetical protein